MIKNFAETRIRTHARSGTAVFWQLQSQIVAQLEERRSKDGLKT